MKFHSPVLVPPELSGEQGWFDGNIFWRTAKTLSDDEGGSVKEVFQAIVNDCVDLIGSILDAGISIFFKLETNLILISNWIWNENMENQF